MTHEKTPSERAAERSEADPFYMASALAAYRRSEEMDAPGIAELLSCAPADLPLLALCRKPGAVGDSEFVADVSHLVRRFGLNRAALVRILRQEKFLLATAPVPPVVTFHTHNPVPMLLAAQDRLDDDLETDDGLEGQKPGDGTTEDGDDGRLAR